MPGRKKILVDAYNIGMSKGTGIATYARNLTHSIHRLGHETHVLYGVEATGSKDKLLDEVTFFDQERRLPRDRFHLARKAKKYAETPLVVTASEVPVTGQVIATSFASRMPHYDRLWNASDVFGRANWLYRKWGGEMKVRIPGGVDLAHWTYTLPMRVLGARNIYTMHDLVPLRLPYTTLDDKKKYLALMQRLARKADHIVTVSEASRTDIMNLLGVPPERVTNTYQAVEVPAGLSDRTEAALRADVEGIYELPWRGYFLFFGAIEPKKNVGRLIEAYLASGIATPLVVVGKEAWQVSQELGLLTGSPAKPGEPPRFTPVGEDRVRRFDFVPYANLLSLIRGARAVTFPSLYEGFGLPVLEAMCMGTPVLSSTEGSIPEIAGDTALLVNPYEVREIAEGLRALDRDENLRADLAARALKQAGLFSTARYEARLKEMYDRVMA